MTVTAHCTAHLEKRFFLPRHLKHKDNTLISAKKKKKKSQTYSMHSGWNALFLLAGKFIVRACSIGSIPLLGRRRRETMGERAREAWRKNM